MADKQVTIVGLTISKLWNEKLMGMYEYGKEQEKKWEKPLESGGYTVTNSSEHDKWEGYCKALSEIGEYVMQFAEKYEKITKE